MDFGEKIQSWKPKMRAFFSTFPWKNLFTFLFFVLMAFIFWLMLFSRRENVEGTYRLPLKYTNVPEDVVFDEPLPKYIETRIVDNGAAIFKYDLKKIDSLEINVADYKKKNINSIQGNELRYLITNQFPKATLISYYPAIVPLATSKLEKKELQVAFDGEITTNAANLIIDSTTFIPEKVTAYSSKQKLAQLKNAITEYTLFENLKSTSQLKIKIKPVEGVKFIPNEVEMYIPIKEYTEKSFDVPITGSNLPQGLDVKFFPSQAKVSFSVTLDEYKKIAPEDFEIRLNYNKFKSNADGRVELELTKSPKSIINPRIAPSSVEFLFENN